MFMAFANLLNNHTNVFPVYGGTKCPKTDTSAIFYSFSFGNMD